MSINELDEKNEQPLLQTILIVDDLPENLRLLSQILIQKGYEVRPAPDGKVALEAIRYQLPDLILLDIKMPEMDGFELCRKIKEDPASSDIPIIFISALEDVDDKVKAFQTGGVDYITKPFQKEEVLARVHMHLSLRQAQIHLEDMVDQRTSQLKEANIVLERSLREKEILLRELYHRTKNNMQIISSLLELQSLEIVDENAKLKFAEMVNRIYSISLVHEKLYKSKDLSRINLNEYINDLSSMLLTNINKKNISITCRGDDITVLVDIAIPCGLICNELITNALQHAFTEKNEGEIKIGIFKRENDEILLELSDDGKGLPDNFNVDEHSSLGLTTVFEIVRHQLNGEIVMENNNGLFFAISFKTNFYHERI